MFETLADQMKIDEQKETTKRERVILWLVARRSEFVSMEGFSCGRRSISI
jgi:hypothetical protein